MVFVVVSVANSKKTKIIARLMNTLKDFSPIMCFVIPMMVTAIGKVKSRIITNGSTEAERRKSCINCSLT